MINKKKGKVYIIGGGIASLSAAVSLIEDGKIDGSSITIFDGVKKMGGSLDAKDSTKKEGYVMRGIRMFEEEIYGSTHNLMSKIPSLINPDKNLREEFSDFNKKNNIYMESRLIRKGKPVESKTLGLGIKDRLLLVKLLFLKEKKLDNLKINQYFSKNFFKSNFWFEFCTVFAFQPWHSLIEFRRYSIRLLQSFKNLDTLKSIQIAPYNQYEGMILPIINFLKKHGVKFIKNVQVTNLGFEIIESKKIVNSIYIENNSIGDKIIVGKDDLTFVSIGSMVANSSFGGMKKPAKQKNKSGIWKLWENIAKNNPNFGKPETFNGDIEKSKWTSFTITIKNKKVLKKLQNFINKKVNSYGGITIVDSNWFISFCITYNKYFKDQKDGVDLCWGYTLNSEKKGNFIKKKVSECSGEEILIELFSHLGFKDNIDEILKDTICIPCITPYITSQFMPRKTGDRPLVIPKGTKNMAFLGQYTEIKDDIVFTVEYSVRSGQMAVNKLLELNKEEIPIYKGTHKIGAIFSAIKTLFR